VLRLPPCARLLFQMAGGVLSGKIALVTGASSGLGLHFSRVLAGAGATVAICARRTERLEALAAEITGQGGEAVPFQLDVADVASVRDCVARISEELGGLDVCVNNAGVAEAKPALSIDEADWDWCADTNLKGAFFVAQAAAQAMHGTGGGGSIINIASVAGIRTLGNLSAYCATKAAVLHLTGQLASEWAKHDIRVNAIAPGYIETEMNSEFFATEAGHRLIQGIPQRRLGEPCDLDGALMLLATDASSFMTGATIAVDGGHSCKAV
jgi:NAD(P)-dependent dehydrogenase (short-subunit alcohol dehydrogenase family)